MLKHQREFLLFTTVEAGVHSSDISDPHRNYDIVINDWMCPDTQKFVRKTERPREFRPSGDIVFNHKLHKWPTISRVLKDIDFESYQIICFMDDDVVIEVEQINKLFLFGQEHGLGLYQPALTPESGEWHKILYQQTGTMHATHFIETMFPFFSGSFLKRVIPFIDLYCTKYQGGWGVDALWTKFALSTGEKVAVVDEIPMYHPGGPVSSGWQLESGGSPGTEYNEIMKDPDLIGWIESAGGTV